MKINEMQHDNSSSSCVRQQLKIIAVIFLAHPSLTGLNSGSGTSGSKAWSNNVRSRIYFTRLDGQELIKSNYSHIGTTVNVRWKDGVFINQGDGAQLDRAALNEKAERVFLALLDANTEQSRSVNSSSGPNYAPTIFACDPKAKDITKLKFATDIKSLFHKKVIINKQRKASRDNFIVQKKP